MYITKNYYICQDDTLSLWNTSNIIYKNVIIMEKQNNVPARSNPIIWSSSN